MRAGRNEGLRHRRTSQRGGAPLKALGIGATYSGSHPEPLDSGKLGYLQKPKCHRTMGLSVAGLSGGPPQTS